MKTWIKWILATVILAVAFHLLTVILYPNVIMGVVMKKAEDTYGGVNKVVHAPPTTSAARRVVRPSPDLLYSACVYDVSKGPVNITARVPDTYWSLSFYETNTDNFFVINDRQVKSRNVEFILTKSGTSYPDAGGTEVIEAPTERGFFLFRMLVQDEDKIEDLIKIQKQAICTPAY
ncbi:MAG: DUF1254 domain-containing protein [Desulfobacterales bacterium]|nr:DUF1254 domain-containing protein [Desulfobacterales bacterium]